MEPPSTIDKKTAVALGAALLIVVVALLVYFSTRAPAQEQDIGSDDARVDISGAAQAPVPETNPFRAETNPFKEYKNPFE